MGEARPDHEAEDHPTQPGKSRIKDVADATRGLVEAVPIYDDALQPGAKQVGKAIETVGKAVNVALAPIAALVWGYEKIGDFLERAVEERLSKVPPENVVTPRPELAGPAVEALRFAGHDESLRELYANLLATAMDRATADKAHPAFVEILKQLTPDEAKLLAFVSNCAPEHLGTITVKATVVPTEANPDLTRGFLQPLRRFTSLGLDAHCAHPELTPTYLDNLERLGILEFDDERQFASDPASRHYESLEAHPQVNLVWTAYHGQDGYTPSYVRGCMNITALGTHFLQSVVVDRRPIEVQE